MARERQTRRKDYLFLNADGGTDRHTVVPCARDLTVRIDALAQEFRATDRRYLHNGV